ncbi:MAG: PEP-CTERM sorting domain-containing protein [Planctomycetes bacterium]|nr:PEP-CTERM sorting domain-containing protein [Planctomycetota bacterium]
MTIAPFPTTPLSGILLDYEVDYPIDPAYPFNPGLFTTTAIDGFSAPPVGLVGTTAGFVHSSIVTLPNTYLVPSISNIPLTLVAGVDNPPWIPAIVANSGVFPFTGATGMVLRQRLTLDGIYNSGPGGVWTIDLPVQTFEAPEPSTLALTALGLTGLGLLACRQKFCRAGAL